MNRREGPDKFCIEANVRQNRGVRSRIGTPTLEKMNFIVLTARALLHVQNQNLS